MSRGRTTRKRRPAFTLVESVGAMAITGVVLATTVGTLQLFTVNGPRLERMEKARGQAGILVHRMRSELRLATTVTELTPTAVTFVMPDTNNDAVDETIRYSWTGTSGDPLMREQNGGAAEAAIADVVRFSVAVDVESKTATADAPSAELLLFSHDATKDLNDFSVNASNGCGQFFSPTLPAEATSWAVTRLQFQAKSRGAATGVTSVELRRATASNKPAATALESQSLSESDLKPTYDWQAFAFTMVTGIPPAEGLCLVLPYVSGGDSCEIRHHDSNVSAYSGMFLETSDSGAFYSADGGKAMRLYVWGTYLSPQPATVAGAMQSVHLELEVKPSGAPKPMRIDTAVPCLNRPSLGGFAIVNLPIESIVPAS